MSNDSPSPSEDPQDATPENETGAAASEQTDVTPESTPTPPSGPGTGLSEDHVREALKEVIDPELFVNIVDLGLIYTVNITDRDDGKYDVGIEMTMTSPMCPAGPQLVANSRDAVSKMDQVEEVDVKVVMDPPWTQDMMTDDAKDQLNIF